MKSFKLSISSNQVVRSKVPCNPNWTCFLLQKLVHIVHSRSIDIHLVHHLELYAISLAKAGYLGVRIWLLCPKLIGGEGENFKIVCTIFGIQFVQFVIVPLCVAWRKGTKKKSVRPFSLQCLGRDLRIFIDLPRWDFLLTTIACYIGHQYHFTPKLFKVNLLPFDIICIQFVE